VEVFQPQNAFGNQGRDIGRITQGEIIMLENSKAFAASASTTLRASMHRKRLYDAGDL